MAESIALPPWPPALSGNATPSSPASAAFRCSSRGSSPSRSHCATFGAISRRVKSAVSLRRASRSGVDQTSVGMAVLDQTERDVDVSRAQPLAEPLRLRVLPGAGGDALAEQAVDDEVERPDVGQVVPVDPQVG